MKYAHYRVMHDEANEKNLSKCYEETTKMSICIDFSITYNA